MLNRSEVCNLQSFGISALSLQMFLKGQSDGIAIVAERIKVNLNKCSRRLRPAQTAAKAAVVACSYVRKQKSNLS